MVVTVGLVAEVLKFWMVPLLTPDELDATIRK
jgi:hypothetical protein